MTQPWRKLGRVLEASGAPLARSHAMLPTPFVMADRLRVFYTACDEDLRGRVFSADFEREPPFRLMSRSAGPVLDLGPPGAFDCDGVNPSQALMVEGRLALLYIGWRRGPAEAPYTLFAGVAFSDDQGATFARGGEPMLGPRASERLFRTAPFVEQRPDGYRLLYIGGDAFAPGPGGKALPIYSLMEMASETLWDWDGPSRCLLAPDRARGEIGFGRPVSYQSDGADRLMLSVRTQDGYRLVEMDRAFAPGTRPPMRPVVPEPLGPWERAMTCFGAPCRVGAHELLFYNGDGFGRTGAGLMWRPAD
ncbi:MAG TPA: sialidase family protein [Caulobacteraceae bacterium]|nr:sialidase family protein [Caulobacteraceae bacterium]